MRLTISLTRALALVLALLVWPASAQMTLTGAGPGSKGAAGVVFSITYEAFATESSGTNTGTFNTIAVGPANSNRVVAVITTARNNTSTAVSSMTIGGVSASLATGTSSPNTTMHTEIWYASVPTGTTANIVVTWNGTTVTSGIQVYSIITSTPTPSSGNANSSASSSSISTTITIPSGGAGITGVSENFTSGTITLSNVTTDASSNLAGPRPFSAGHTTTTGSVSPTATFGSAGGNAMSSAAWSP